MSTKTKTETRAGIDMREDRPGANAMTTTSGTPPERTAAEQGQIDDALRLKHTVAARMELLETKRDDLEPMLRANGVEWEVFLATCRRALAKTPKVAFCTATSFIFAVMDAARLGLAPDGVLCAIVPFKNEATLVPMYQGFLNIIYRTGLMSAVSCQVVYEGEEEFLDYDLGDNPYVTFKPPLNRNDGQKIIGAFATATSADGVGKWVEIMSQKDLVKAKAVNKAEGVGKAWPSEMARKTPLRRMAKFLPRHPSLDMLLAIDAKSYTSKPKVEGRAKPRLSDRSLLSDDPEPQAENEAEDAEFEDSDDSTPAIHRYTEMVNQADEGDMLESRVALIMAQAEYDTLDVTEKALLDMVIRERRELFGLDPETGAAADA